MKSGSKKYFPQRWTHFEMYARPSGWKKVGSFLNLQIWHYLHILLSLSFDFLISVWKEWIKLFKWTIAISADKEIITVRIELSIKLFSKKGLRFWIDAYHILEVRVRNIHYWKVCEPSGSNVYLPHPWSGEDWKSKFYRIFESVEVLKSVNHSVSSWKPDILIF